MTTTKNNYIPTGLRERPVYNKKSKIWEKEQPYHMTAILKKLYPNIPITEWQVEELVDLDGNVIINKTGHSYKPDFLSRRLKLIIEIDGASSGKGGGHMVDKDTTEKDVMKKKLYESLGYRLIAIPSYIQLDAEMINYYFGINYTEKLYEAASEHGFAHPQIPLPSMFCKLGAERFMKDMRSLPKSVTNKIIVTLKDRISQFEDEGFTHEDAVAKVLLPSMQHLIDN